MPTSHSTSRISSLVCVDPAAALRGASARLRDLELLDECRPVLDEHRRAKRTRRFGRQRPPQPARASTLLQTAPPPATARVTRPGLSELEQHALRCLAVGDRIGAFREQQRDLRGRQPGREEREERLRRIRQAGRARARERSSPARCRRRGAAASRRRTRCPLRAGTRPTVRCTAHGRPTSRSCPAPPPECPPPSVPRPAGARTPRRRRRRRCARRCSSASTPGTSRSASRMLSASSRKSVGDVKFAICSVRNTVHSLPGSSIPAATTARHPRPVPLGRAFASVANGMP